MQINYIKEYYSSFSNKLTKNKKVSYSFKNIICLIGISAIITKGLLDLYSYIYLGEYVPFIQLRGLAATSVSALGFAYILNNKRKQKKGCSRIPERRAINRIKKEAC